MASPNLKPPIKPHVGAIEPYAEAVLDLYSKGYSSQRIALWLKDSPRNIPISRQGVFQWINIRNKKISKRANASGWGSALNQTPPLPARDPVGLAALPESVQTAADAALVDPSPIARIPMKSDSAYEPLLAKKKPLVDISDFSSVPTLSHQGVVS